jgi:hypothetical protein
MASDDAGLRLVLQRGLVMPVLQHATFNVQHAAWNVQNTTCSMQLAAYNVQSATCNMQHATCSRVGLSRCHTALHIGCYRACVRESARSMSIVTLHIACVRRTATT